MDTPIIVTSTRLRDDLWLLAQRLKTGEGFRCAQTTLAELEVALVWAGHEYEEMGWRHSVPHIDRAERLADQALQEYNNCGQPMSPVECPQQRECPPARVIRQPQQVPIQRAAELMPKNVHFAFDSARISGASENILREVIRVMRRAPSVTLRLVGHTDRYGDQNYNSELSRKRVQNVKRFLLDSGVSSTRLRTSAAGERDLARDGCDPQDHAYNRRVEFQVEDGAGVRYRDATEDLKVSSGQRGCGSRR